MLQRRQRERRLQQRPRRRRKRGRRSFAAGWRCSVWPLLLFGGVRLAVGCAELVEQYGRSIPRLRVTPRAVRRQRTGRPTSGSAADAAAAAASWPQRPAQALALAACAAGKRGDDDGEDESQAPRRHAQVRPVDG